MTPNIKLYDYFDQVITLKPLAQVKNILTTSDNANPNYMAEIFKISEIEKHPNADKLQIVVVNNFRVITNLDYKIGDLAVYFPVETQINAKFLSFIDAFSNADKNLNKVKGYFSNSGRVKMLKLRGTYSEGWIAPARLVVDYVKKTHDTNIEITDVHVGQTFDTINNERFCQKYEVAVPAQATGKAKSKGNVKKYQSKLVEHQFRFHEDTEALKRNVQKVDPDDYISITNKIHGCNFIVSHLLVKKPLSFIDKVAKFFGANVQDTEYGNLYASRAVIKNKNFETDASMHFYDSDIWKIVSDQLFPKLDKGISVVGEIYGYTPSGKYIQPEYDYGKSVGELGFTVFKVTYTTANGEVYVLSHRETVEWCHRNNVEMPKTFYYGKARDLFPELDVTEHWHKEFLAKLQEKYLEKKCDICKNDVWAEGIILRVDTPNKWFALKLKSLGFLGYETEQLDKEVVSIEQQEEQETPTEET